MGETLMTNEEVQARLADHGAIVTGSHFVFTKEDHGPAYINKDRVCWYPLLT